MSEKLSLGRKGHEKKGLDFSQGKKAFTVPKLTFVEPRLTKHGDATKITTGFGTFFP